MALLRHAGKPVVATCRPVWERGAFRGSERARLAILDAAASMGAQYVDLEWKIGRGPIGSMGLGRNSVSSRSRVPIPPHRTTTFTSVPSR